MDAGTGLVAARVKRGNLEVHWMNSFSPDTLSAVVEGRGVKTQQQGRQQMLQMFSERKAQASPSTPPAAAVNHLPTRNAPGAKVPCVSAPWAMQIKPG